MNFHSISLAIWMPAQAYMQPEITARSRPYSHSGRCAELLSSVPKIICQILVIVWPDWAQILHTWDRIVYHFSHFRKLWTPRIQTFFNNEMSLAQAKPVQCSQLKFYYKYKNNKLPHYLQALPFHPNTRTHDHNTPIKHNTHHPIAKHIFAKNCVHFGIPRIVNDCPNSISDKINTIQLLCIYKNTFLQWYQENCTIVACYVCNN